jgi:zinc transport system permease protein
MHRPLLAVLICFAPLAGASADELVGTIRHFGPAGEVYLRDDDGKEHTVIVPSRLLCRTGLNGDGLEEISIHQGALVRVALAGDGKTATEVQVIYPWYAVPSQWLDERLTELKDSFPPNSLLSNKQMLLGLISIVLVSLICGAVSSLVLSNRMAFFSDALAHFAFAGVALGILLHLAGWLINDDWIVPVMVLFGIMAGCGIAYVKQRTVLANDTIIGVFFAGAMGLGAVLLIAVAKIGGGRGVLKPENFLFGELMATTSQQIVYLLILLVVTILFLTWRYNGLIMSSFNPSLARSRRISVQLGNYLFIIFLAMTVNACLKAVGALLINALLILPAATAGNVSKNLRLFFWMSLMVSMIAGVGGFLVSATWEPVVGGKKLPLSSGGVIVLLGTLCFFASMLLGPLLRGNRPIPSSNT